MDTQAKPVRIQMRRTKGWLKPEGCIYVGRPTTWGNWHRIGGAPLHYSGPAKDAAEAVLRFADDCASMSEDFIREWTKPLRGHPLGCWCPLDQPCHADVLLELANSDICSGA